MIPSDPKTITGPGDSPRRWTAAWDEVTIDSGATATPVILVSFSLTVRDDLVLLLVAK
jgi:hypothetical protein